MSETEHTPGPWEAQAPSLGEHDEWGVAIIGLRTNDGVPYDSPTNGLVAFATMFPTEIDAKDPSRAMANARVIAAAPELLAALIAITELVERVGDSRKDAPYVEAAQDAIAKAQPHKDA